MASPSAAKRSQGELPAASPRVAQRHQACTAEATASATAAGEAPRLVAVSAAAAAAEDTADCGTEIAISTTARPDAMRHRSERLRGLGGERD